MKTWRQWCVLPHWLFMVENNFSRFITIPTNIVLCADTYNTWFPDINIAKVRNNLVSVSESAYYGQDSGLLILESRTKQEQPFKMFSFWFILEAITFFFFWPQDVMVMLLHKGGRYLLFHAKNACLNQTRELGQYNMKVWKKRLAGIRLWCICVSG